MHVTNMRSVVVVVAVVNKTMFSCVVVVVRVVVAWLNVVIRRLLDIVDIFVVAVVVGLVVAVFVVVDILSRNRIICISIM